MPIDSPVHPVAVVAQAAAVVPNVAGFRPIPLRPSAIGHFHLSGRIGGKTVEILIDTGASNTVIDRSWADANGLTMKAMDRQGAGVGGATLALSMLDEHMLELEGFEILANIVAIDLTGVKAGLARANVAPPQIVLGVDVLRSRRAVIDYATSTLWLARTPNAG